MSGVEGLFFYKPRVRMKIDLKKTVLLFASIHLLIAFVADRQGKMKTKVTNTRSVSGSTAIEKTKLPGADKFFGLINGH